MNLWRYFNATNHVTFGGTTVTPAPSSAAIADVTAGVDVNVTARGSVFVNVHYAMNVTGARRTTIGGDAGVHWRW
ncbi:hypothetical protein M0D69_00935 [Caballeronia sp. SEWSISQ10-4 2]|nr:hypothetical protein [Caballeronia sp. SEWSISQ10-4 2]